MSLRSVYLYLHWFELFCILFDCCTLCISIFHNFIFIASFLVY